MGRPSAHTSTKVKMLTPFSLRSRHADAAALDALAAQQRPPGDHPVPRRRSGSERQLPVSAPPPAADTRGHRGSDGSTRISLPAPTADRIAVSAWARFVMPPAVAEHSASVRMSVPWRSCLGYGHAGCPQRCHRRPPAMCGLRTRPRTDVDPPRFLPPSNCHRRGAYRLAVPATLFFTETENINKRTSKQTNSHTYTQLSSV